MSGDQNLINGPANVLRCVLGGQFDHVAGLEQEGLFHAEPTGLPRHHAPPSSCSLGPSCGQFRNNGRFTENLSVFGFTTAQLPGGVSHLVSARALHPYRYLNDHGLVLLIKASEDDPVRESMLNQIRPEWN